ncbi:MAG TPA: KEOPS complex subunit Pcc1 [Thermoplasmata archaeon]|nr:KEOPS complex subunit Pcc1 [Thermoplasmata archaeon]
MTVRLERTYASADAAQRLEKALRADAPPNLVAQVEGATLRFVLTSPTAASARATLEDLLACLAAAEKTLELGSTRPPDRP